jgi:hypothetical protein
MNISTIGFLVNAMVMVADVYAAPPLPPGHSPLPPPSWCGSPGKPACKSPGMISCQVQYSYGITTSSGEESISYSEMQQWVVSSEWHKCRKDPHLKCVSYIWTATGIGTDKNQDKGSIHSSIASTYVRSIGKGEFYLSGVDQVSVYLDPNVRKFESGNYSMNDHGVILAYPAYEWPIDSAPAPARQPRQYSFVPGSLWLTPSASQAVSCDTFFTRE